MNCKFYWTVGLSYSRQLSGLRLGRCSFFTQLGGNLAKLGQFLDYFGIYSNVYKLFLMILFFIILTILITFNEVIKILEVKFDVNNFIYI